MRTSKAQRINWAISKSDLNLVHKILDRYEVRNHRTLLQDGYKRDNLRMDLVACHLNGTPLDLAKLLDAPDFDFIHDLAGITANIDRTTGQLSDLFLPRCALPEDHHLDTPELGDRVSYAIQKGFGWETGEGTVDRVHADGKHVTVVINRYNRRKVPVTRVTVLGKAA